MKKIKTIFYLFILLSNSLFSQKIQELVSPDTLINTSIKVESTWEKPVTAFYDNKIWIYQPLWDGNDSVLFIRYDLKKHSFDSIVGFVPNLFLRIKNPRVNTLSINDSYCVLTYLNALVVFNMKNNRLEFNKISPLNETYSYSDIHGDSIFFGKVFNYHPLDEANKTAFVIYDIKKDVFLNYVNPEFENIEFSNFFGYHWIDSKKDKIIFSQTTSYKISVFTSDFKKVNEISRPSVKNWVSFNNKVMERFRKKISPDNVKDLIDSLLPYHQTVSRVEGVYFCNDSTIMVRYIPANHVKKNNQRNYDFWRFKKNKWVLLYSDFQDQDIVDNSTVINKNNYSLEGYNFNSYFYGEYLIQVRASVPIYPFGKTLKKYNQEVEKYLSRNNPEIVIAVFKLTIH